MDWSPPVYTNSSHYIQKTYQMSTTAIIMEKQWKPCTCLQVCWPIPSTKFRAGTAFVEILYEMTISGLICIFGVFFRKCVLLEELAKEPANKLNPNMFGFGRFYNVFQHFRMQIRCKKQMYLSTSPTCFEGPRGRKTGFGDPGPESRV